MAEHGALSHHRAAIELHPTTRVRVLARTDPSGGERVGIVRVRKDPHLAGANRRFGATGAHLPGRGAGRAFELGLSARLLFGHMQGDGKLASGAGSLLGRGIAGRFATRERAGRNLHLRRLRQAVARSDAAEARIGEQIAVGVAQHHVTTELARRADPDDAPILHRHHGRFSTRKQLRQLRRRRRGVQSPFGASGADGRRRCRCRAGKSGRVGCLTARRGGCGGAGLACGACGVACGAGRRGSQDILGDLRGRAQNRACDGKAALGQPCQGGDYRRGVAGEQARAEQHRFDIGIGMVVCKDRRPQVG